MTLENDICLIIIKARKNKGLKQEVLGMMVGCSGSYITKLEKGDAIPSPLLAMKLEKVLKLKDGALVKTLLDIKMRETRLRRQAVLEARKLGPRFDLTENTLVPLYRCSSTIWDDEVESYIAMPNREVKGRDFFLLRVNDDGNDGEGIHKGDILLVEIKDGASSEICVYCIGKNYFVKRCKVTGNRIRMSPNSSNARHKTTAHLDGKGSDILWKGVVRAIYLKKILTEI